MNLNKVTLIGNLTRDPAGKKLPSGQQVTFFSLATNYSWKDAKTKERKESVEFHNIVAWGRLAEIVTVYLKKGDKIYLEGRLRSRKWQDKDGKNHAKVEIIAENMIMLGKSSMAREKVATEAQRKLSPEAENVEVVEAN